MRLISTVTVNENKTTRHRGTKRGIFAVDVLVRPAELKLRCAVCM